MVKDNNRKLTARLVPKDDVLVALGKFVKDKGTQAQAAESLGIDFSYLNLMLHERRPIPDLVAEKLGYRHLDLYEIIPVKAEEPA